MSALRTVLPPDAAETYITGNTDLVGTSLSYNDHPGAVLGTRWVE